MTTKTSSDTNGTANALSEIPTAPEAHKSNRKRRMAREPGASPPVTATPSPTTGGGIAASPSSESPSVPSKVGTIITMLRRDHGTSLAEIIAATGWLPHTTRAALTGLRKKNHVIERTKRGDVTVWRIVGEA